MEQLKLSKGGKLVAKIWDSKIRKYYKKDVSEFAIKHLFDSCILDKNVTLRDVFLLINKNLYIFDHVFGKWTKELVTEGLKGKKTHKNLQMQYLEIYWFFSREKDCKTKKQSISGYTFPSFHGIGTASKTDKKNGNIKGKEIKYSLSFLTAADLVDIPLRLNQELIIYNMDDSNEKSQSLGLPVYSLGHILYGIIWELSFYGSPNSRDKKGQELKNNKVVSNKKNKDMSKLLKLFAN